MKKAVLFALPPLLLLFSCFPVWSEAQVLRLNTALKPPLSIGFGLILSEAFGRMGYEVIVQELPGERALKNANKGLDDGDAARIIEISETYTNLIRIPESIVDVKIVAFSKKSDIHIEGWKGLRPYNVAIVQGYKIMENNIKGTRSLVMVENIHDLFTLLKKDRTDLVVINRLEGLAEIKKQNIDDVVVLDSPIEIRPLYPHLHKKHKHLVPELTEVLRKMKDEGTLEQLFEQALELHVSGKR